MSRGAYEMKEQVDKDAQGGFPILNFIVLFIIATILYLIWDKLD